MPTCAICGREGGKRAIKGGVCVNSEPCWRKRRAETKRVASWFKKAIANSKPRKA